ncbi:hypothetical protein [Tranquillimonas alkanivorans]|uniref:Cytochrome c domain-containing protein n=1 Tax=Tranquillimonas alkanivorans TaxID=441119 RepID=A0A1I5KI42_9RHOB|nr:hypothetical protein [Tranquillimonas alkanivorans]SFO84734.1 hypothetical protein SAMN04488047_101127 [Tranquillimonas alkanivorans]
MLLRAAATCAALWLPLGAAAESFTLSAPAALDDKGFLQYLLPRFTLKTGNRIERADEGAELALVAEPPGTRVFRDGERVWRLRGDGDADGAAADFADWITSDIGIRTIESFAPDGTPVYSATFEEEETEAAVEYAGDPDEGEDLSLALCGRCHVVGARNRMKGLGSTPSFGVMRTFPDWEGRFLAFFALKPHGAFTVIEGVTPPFDDALPPPIAPVEMTLDELDAIVAFVAGMEPADLGAPVQAR